MPNQLRLHAENGLGKKERQLWIGDGGPLTSAKRLPKLPDLIAQRLSLVPEIQLVRLTRVTP